MDDSNSLTRGIFKMLLPANARAGILDGTEPIWRPMQSEAQFQTKILTRTVSDKDYKVYRAALDWDLTEPIVIESADDLKLPPAQESTCALLVENRC